MTADLRSAPPPPLTGDDHVRGPDGAPVVLVYADLTCPRCALAHARLDGAPLRVAARHLALRAKHPRAVALAHLVEAAALQGAFWPLHDALLADQGRQDDPHVWALAERLGIDVGRLEDDRRSPAVAARVERDTRTGLRAGAMHTPTLFLPGGRRLDGPPTEAQVSGIH